MKTVHLVSLGCPKNLVDSEVMLGSLEQIGLEVCDKPEEADLLVVNTCGFIQSAVEEAIEEILELTEIKKRFPDKRLVVTGCLVQRYGAELQKELPEVDLFIGTDGFHDIVQRLDDLPAPACTDTAANKVAPSYVMDACTPRRLSTPSYRAYLKITEGCSNRCAYCIIPTLRGTLRSRTPDDVLEEVRLLDTGSLKELTLIAQDLTAYGLDLPSKDARLVPLIKNILAHSAIPWVRLLYLYPARLDDALLDLMAQEPRLLSYLDLPLQHVSDSVLKRMNRPYGLRKTEALIDRIRTRLPNAALRATFMVGFPGETDKEFSELYDFLKRHELDHVGIFTYSNEPGCAAEKLANHCPEELKEERRVSLMELQAEICQRKNQQYIGRTEPVLVEGLSKETDLLLEGRTRFQAPDIDGCVYINSGECRPGEIVDVTFTDAHVYDLVGEIVTMKTT